MSPVILVAVVVGLTAGWITMYYPDRCIGPVRFDRLTVTIIVFIFLLGVVATYLFLEYPRIFY